MAKYLNLQVPESCQEDWNKMLPDQQGKFCLSCQKKVVDFTSMSDRQLTNYFKNHKGNTCGRFNADQLDRDIVILENGIPWLRYLFQITIPAFLLSVKATGQAKIHVRQKVEAVLLLKAPAVNTLDNTVNKNSVTVEGTVSDEEGMAIPGASIMVKGTSIGTAADGSGKFRLEGVQAPTVLVISSVGYQAKIWYLGVDQEKADIVMTGTIQMKTIVAGGAVAVVRSTRRQKKTEKKEECVKPVSPVLSVYPNPVTPNTAIHLKWKGLIAGNYSVEVHSISGALVHTQKLEMESWMNEYVLQSKLMTGNYVVTITNSKDGKRLSQQLQVVY